MNGDVTRHRISPHSPVIGAMKKSGTDSDLLRNVLQKKERNRRRNHSASSIPEEQNFQGSQSSSYFANEAFELENSLESSGENDATSRADRRKRISVTSMDAAFGELKHSNSMTSLTSIGDETCESKIRVQSVRGSRHWCGIISQLYAKALILTAGFVAPFAKVFTDSTSWGYNIIALYYHALSVIALLFFIVSRVVEMITRAKEKTMNRAKSKVRFDDWTMEASDSLHVHVAAVPKPNLYLRIGAVFSGLVTLTQSWFRLSWIVEKLFDENCDSHNFTSVTLCALEIIFKLLQIYLIVAPFQLYTPKLRCTARFFSQHLLATNFIMIFSNFVEETLTELAFKFHEMTVTGAIKNDSCFARGGLGQSFDLLLNCTLDSPSGIVLKNATPYTYPLEIQYNLIAMVSLYVIWRMHGKRSKVGLFRNVAVKALQKKPRRSLESFFQQIYANSFFGAIVGILTILWSSVCIFSLFFWGIEDKLSIQVNYSIEIFIYYSSLLAIFIATYRMKKIPMDRSTASMETILPLSLMWVSCIGTIMIHTFELLAAIYTNNNNYLALVDRITQVGALLHAAIQMLFVIGATHKRISNAKQQQEKPGRQFIIFLILANLSMWILYTFRPQFLRKSQIQTDFYSFATWLVISNFFMPMTSFFHLLSTAVLGNMWWTVYIPKTKVLAIT